MANPAQEMLIGAGVRNLKTFGYPAVNKKNILTDPIYSRFFDSMLADNLGKGHDADINALRERIKKSAAIFT